MINDYIGKIAKSLIFVVLLTALFLQTCIIVSAEAPVISVSVNSETGEVNVRCATIPNRRVTLFVLNPNTPDHTLADINDSNLSNVVHIVRVGVSDSNGICDFYFSLSADAVSGWYVVKIGIEGTSLTESQRTARFYFADEGEVLAARAAVNNATIENVVAVLNEYNIVSPILGLDFNADYERVTNEAAANFLLLRAAEPNQQFASIASIQVAFRRAIGWALLDIVQAGEMARVFEEYGAVLLPPNSGDFERTEAIKNETIRHFERMRNLLPNQKFASLPLLQSTFRESLAIAMINNSSRSDITSVLNAYNDVFNLNLTSYNSLSHNDSMTVNRELFQRNFNSIDAIRTAFATAIAGLNQQVTTPGTPSRGGGGGGLGGTVVIAPPDDALALRPIEPPTAPATGFSDLADVEWARESIEALYHKNIISGVGNNLFYPSGMVTREQFVKMLVLAAGISNTNAVAEFLDVNPNEWYYSYIASAVELGIVFGKDDNTFGVGVEITREDIAVLAVRAVQKTGAYLPEITDAASFNDSGYISDYAVESVEIMQRAGIISGVGDNYFAPRRSATRAEAARIIYGLLNFFEVMR